jgi:hypothetical protein
MSGGIAERGDRNSLKFKRVKRRPGALNIAQPQSQDFSPSPGTMQENTLMTWLLQTAKPRPPFTTTTEFTPQSFEFLDKDNPSSGCFGTVFQWVGLEISTVSGPSRLWS